MSLVAKRQVVAFEEQESVLDARPHPFALLDCGHRVRIMVVESTGGLPVVPDSMNCPECERGRL